MELTLPPLFAEACGYRGRARFVGLCWIPGAGELWWSDDGHATLGSGEAFVTLCRHPATTHVLARYELGALDDGTRPWLIVDRDRRRMSVGSPRAVWRKLESQADGRPSWRGVASQHPLRQRELVRGVTAWLDWMGLRGAGG
ncbi:MAG TPA: hypothetical protein VGI67_22450 [Thermoleophilaceae bacterium]